MKAAVIFEVLSILLTSAVYAAALLGVFWLLGLLPG